MTHEMPAYTTLSRPRSLTMLYNSAQGAPKPVVAVAVRQATGTALPNSIYAELRVNGVLKASGTYPAWNAAPLTRQIALTYDASADSSGVYPFTLEVQNRYTVGGNFGTTVSGNLIVVNRSKSKYGRGWAIAGVEELRPGQPGGAILWVGGDGSAKLYSQVNATTWRAAAGGFRETLTLTDTMYTRTLRHGVQVKYGPQGRHLQTITRAGDTTKFMYSASGRLDTIAVPPGGTGTKYVLAYDGSGFLDKITDPGSRVLNATMVVVNSTTRSLSSLLDPDGVSVGFTYSSPGHMLTRTGRRGFQTTYRYDNALRVRRVAIPIDPAIADSAIIAYTPWDEHGLPGLLPIDTALVVTTIKGPRVNVNDDAKFSVDRWGAPTKIVDPVGAITSLVRGDPLVPMMVTQVTYPKAAGAGAGRIVKMSYDTLANLLEVRDSTSHLLSAGLPTRVTAYEYLSSNNKFAPSKVKELVGAAWRTTSYTYTSLGLTKQVTDPRGHRTIFDYGTGAFAGLVDSVTEKEVETWVDSVGFAHDTSFAVLDHGYSFAFDAKGNLKTATSPERVVTSYARDTYGRVTNVYDPVGFRQQWIYDLMNRTTRTGRYTGKTTHPNSLNPLGQCRPALRFCSADSVQSPALGGGVFVDYDYGPADLESITDARGVTRSFIYDARGLMIEERDGYSTPNTRRTQYDAAGNVIRRIWGVDAVVVNTVIHAYDVAGRLTSAGYRSGPYGLEGTVPADTIRYTYDQTGNRLTATNLQGSVVRSYYADGSLKSRKVSGAVADSLFFTYDESGARTSMSHTAAGATDAVTYALDSLTGDLDSLTVTWGAPANLTRTVSFLWDELGRRRQIVYPNNMKVRYRYDASGILRRLVATNDSGTGSSDRFDFTFRADSVDPAGQVMRQRTTCAYLQPDVGLGHACGANPVLNQSSRYNRFGKLVSQHSGLLEEYDYDASDNLIYRKRGSEDAHWFKISQKSDRVIADSIDGVPPSQVLFFLHDSAGGRTHELYNIPNGIVRKYFYDGMGRTSGMRDSDYPGINRHNCINYDADGSIQAPCDDQGNRLVYDGPNVVGAVGVRRWEFVHGPGIDDPIMGLYRATNPTAFKEWYWVTDGAGRQFATGAPDGKLGSLPSTEYTEHGGSYAGGTQNSNTFGADRFASPVLPGISFFRNRVYDQGSGRWTQEDPIGVAGGLNLYQFNGNNPVSFSDPFGLAPCPPDCGAEDAADLGAGFVPGVSTLHDAATLLTGKNLITGEQVGAGGRAIALVGLVTPASGGQVRGLIAGAKHVLSGGLQRVTGDLSDRALQRTYKGAIDQINRHKEILQSASPEQVNSIMKDIVKHEKRLQAAVQELERRGMSPP